MNILFCKLKNIFPKTYKLLALIRFYMLNKLVILLWKNYFQQ